MSRPTLVFLPGFWEGPTAYSKVLNIINSKHSYPTQVIPLSSTGTSIADGKDFTSDVVAIRDAVSKLANEGQEIVFTMHSAGAYVGSQALKDLGLAHRKQRGEAGGVAKLVYLTGALLPEGMDHPPQPLFQTVGDKMYPHEPLTTLFNDFHSHEAESYANHFSWQPASYVGSIHISYCAWRDIPSVYLCCTQDNMMPLDFQYQIAAMAGAETENCDAGHMVVLSQPEKVVEVVLKAAGDV